MKRASTGAVFALLALAFAGQDAEAQGSKSWFVCGGTTFHTCASVVLEVGPADAYGVSTVQLNIWNLSGMAGTYEGSVFTKIGFFNAGSVVALTSPPLEMSGPVRDGDDPLAWVLEDPNNAGGVTLDLSTASTSHGALNNGIANACDPSALPGGINQLWQNPCLDGDVEPTLAQDGWITMTFNVQGEWDLETTELMIQAQNGPNGMSTQCITGSEGSCTLAPEPSTWLLLGTGLAALALVGLYRRREEEQETV